MPRKSIVSYLLAIQFLQTALFSGTSSAASTEEMMSFNRKPAQASTSESAEVKTYDKSKFISGEIQYVQVPNLNVRAEPLSTGKLVTVLHSSDQVEVVNTLDETTPFVEIKIVKSGSSAAAGTRLFASGEYLASKKLIDLANAEKASKYFVIQNVATETVRVYERCKPASPGEECDHRLILESDMVVGRRKKEDGDAQRWYTWLGHFKITGWRKFHQDGSGHYPSWYDPSYPPVPAPGSSFKKWFSKDAMPNPEENVMRGAFGWFAAFTGPNSNDQWIHGTAGWGADGDKYVQVTRNFFVNMIKDARSSGCTRVENGLIAYLRDLLPVGTEFVRVYSWEGTKDKTLAAYASQRENAKFDYILTTEAVRTSGPTIQRDAVIKRGVPQNQWLEEGSYSIDQYPTVRKYKTSILFIGAGTGALGNVYRIKKSEFKGVYLIDTGRFVNYQHPKVLKVGGFPGAAVPEYMVSTDSRFDLEFDNTPDQPSATTTSNN